MSRTTTSTVTLQRERLAATLRAAVGSHQLRRLAQTPSRTALHASDILHGLEARTTTILATTAVVDTLASYAPTALATSTALRDRGRMALTNGDVAVARDLALQGDRVLRDALLTTAATVAREERVAATDVVGQALTNIGCTVRVSTGEAKTGIWAERDDQMVAVQLDDESNAQIDIAGCDGDACTPLHDELDAELSRLGVRLDDVSETEHGDERGGTLIQRAAAVRGKKDMAEGIVLARPSRFENTPAPAWQRSRLEVD